MGRCMFKMLRDLIVVCQPALYCSPAHAASFDCSRAEYPDEVAICADASLSKQDEIVSQAYQQAKAASGKKKINKITRKLLDARHACGNDVSCIDQNQRDSLNLYRRFGATVLFEGTAANQPNDVQASPGIDLDMAVRGEEYPINQETFLFTICNRFHRDVNIALAYRANATSSDFTVVGWFKVKRDQCMDMGSYWKGDFLYTAASDDRTGLWGRQERLCVGTNAFQYTYSPGQSCGDGFTMPFTHIFAVRDHETQTLTP